MSDARKELIRQIARLRDALDPKVVKRLDLAKEGKVPYDRDTAHEAVRRFLAGRQDDGAFRTRLKKVLAGRRDES